MGGLAQNYTSIQIFVLYNNYINFYQVHRSLCHLWSNGQKSVLVQLSGGEKGTWELLQNLSVGVPEICSYI